MFNNLIQSIRESLFFNPIWISENKLRSLIKANIISLEITPSDNWLDVGCGTRPYESYFSEGHYVGVDVESSGRDKSLKAPEYYYDGQVLPFPDNNFDWTEIFPLFKKPNVKNFEIKFPKIDGEKIKKLLVEEHDFSEDRVNKQIERLNKINKEKQQKSLGDWI